MGGKVKLLVDGRNAEVLGILRAANFCGLTFPENFTFIADVGTRENFDQR